MRSLQAIVDSDCDVRAHCLACNRTVMFDSVELCGVFQRKGRSLPFVVANEGDAVPYVRDHVGTLATIHADEGSGWDALHAGWNVGRVNHSVQFMDKGVCTNQAESYFSRLRRMEGSYAREAAWREDNRRVDNGSQAMMVTASAMASPVSRNWKGYWQRAN